MDGLAFFLFLLGWTVVAVYLGRKRLLWLWEPTIPPAESALPLPPRTAQPRLNLRQVRFGGALPGPAEIYGGHPVRAGGVSESKTERYEVRHTELNVDVRWVKAAGHLVELVSPDLLLLEFGVPDLKELGEDETRWLGPAHRVRDLRFEDEDRQCGLGGENGRLAVLYWGEQRARESVVALAIDLADQLRVRRLIPAMGRPELRSTPSPGEEGIWRCPDCGAPGVAEANCRSCAVPLVPAWLGELAEATVLPPPDAIRRIVTVRGEQVLSKTLELLAPHRIPAVLIGDPPRLCVFEQDRARAKMLLRALEEEGDWD